MASDEWGDAITVGRLFDRKPSRWGLRGDEPLWEELQSRLADVALPDTVEDFQRLLENAFWEATGQSLAFCRDFGVPRFDRGGMSGGMVNGDFWRNEGFPQIIMRYRAAKTATGTIWDTWR
ncbi:hypothetical protein [Yoonia sp. 2307UL14-13]|uniref:hypothetical protein n=1 Tax=Yoonia sp. 2307UL14-13 TaxID=3126506 RepID=UPI0030AFBDAF